MKKTAKKTTKRLTAAEKIKRLRSLLVKACDKQVKAGKGIASGTFATNDGDCCPIQCAVGPNVNDGYAEALSKKLRFKFDEEDMWLFIDGFDGHAGNHSDDPVFKLGRALRAKYKEAI